MQQEIPLCGHINSCYDEAAFLANAAASNQEYT